MFDSFNRLHLAFNHIAEMKVKKPQIMGKVCRKLAKHLLSNWNGKDEAISLKKDDIKCQLMENIRVIMNVARNHMRDNEAAEYKPNFIRKYSVSHKVATVVHLCIEYLEKDRQYDVACLLLTKLLLNVDVKP